MLKTSNAHGARTLGAGLALVVGLGVAAPGSAQDTSSLRIGIVTFLSGGAAGPFGVPARNAAELMVSALNEGSVPAPYDSKGIAGATIEPIIIDEAGGTQTQVSEYRWSSGRTWIW